VEGTVDRPVVFPTSCRFSPLVCQFFPPSQCENAKKTAKSHLHDFPPLILSGVNKGQVDQDQRDYYNKQISDGKRDCDRQGDYAGRPFAYNEAGALMTAFIELWRALDSGFYRESPLSVTDAPQARALIPFVVTRHQRYFANRLRLRNDPALGARYEWNYNDGVPGPHIEDTSHGNLDMLYVSVLRDTVDRLNAVTAPAGEPFALDDAIARRLANTFLQEIARPDEIDAGGHLGCRVDGSTSKCKYSDPWADNSVTFGWVNLASVDPTVYRLVRDVELRLSVRPDKDNPDPGALQNDLTMANHSALLANKRYSRQISNLDITLWADSVHAASDPFGWVFAAQDVQDVTFRGIDGHVYELWRETSGRTGYTNLSANAGAPRAVGDPKGYDFPALGTHNVVYRGTDAHLHALSWTTGAVGHDDLTTLSRAPAPAGNPFPYVSPPFGVQNVVYRGTDGHLHALYWSTGAVGHDDITRLSGAPAPAGDPFGYFITTQGVQNVVYRGVDGHLHGLYWGLGAVGHDDLTLLSEAPLPSGNPTAYVTTAGLQTLVYRGTDGHIHGLYWTTGAVSHDDLSENGVKGAPLPVGNLEAYFNAEDESNHVIYRTSNGHLHELAWTTGAVSHADLSTVTPAQPSAGKPSAYVFAPDKTQHVIYRASGGDLHDLTWRTPVADGTVLLRTPSP